MVTAEAFVNSVEHLLVIQEAALKEGLIVK